MSRTNDQPQLDKTNVRILERLCQDGRVAYSALATEMNCSVNTVRDRIMAMERRGVIRGYRAVVDPAATGLAVRALVLVQQDPYHDGTRFDPDAVPGCLEAHRSTGTHALALEIAARSLEELHETIHTHIYGQGMQSARIIPLNGKVAPDTGSRRIGTAPADPEAVAANMPGTQSRRTPETAQIKTDTTEVKSDAPEVKA